MMREHFRYFIELRPALGALPRAREAERSRNRARAFVRSLLTWLEENRLGSKLASASVTEFGQILLTCEADLLPQLREVESFDIAAIRPGALPSPNLLNRDEMRAV